ncbi:MAG: hypothetical protein ACPG5B_13625 [Chitinophagales bacterium]
MIRQYNLYRLIHSLSQGEKRSFRFYAKKYQKKNDSAYVRLYEILNGMASYNAEILEKSLKNERFYKQTSVVSNQLFNLILASLHTRKLEHNPMFLINEKVEFAQILFERGLFRDSKNYIVRAKEIAQNTQQYEQLLFVFSQEHHLMKHWLSIKDYQIYAYDLRKEQKKVWKIVQNQHDFSELIDKLYHIYRQHDMPRNEEETNRYRHLFEHELLKDEKHALSLKARIDFHRIYMFYYESLGKRHDAYKHIRLQLDLLNENDFFIKVYPDTYISVLNNVLFVGLELAKYDEYHKHLLILQHLEKKIGKLNKYLAYRIWEITYSTKLEYFVKLQQIEQGLQLVEDIKKGVNNFQNVGLRIDRIIRMYFGVALLFFYDNNWQKASEWTAKVLEYENSKTALHIMGYTKILDLLLHFNQKNYHFLQHQTKTVWRYLQRNNRLFELEMCILKYLKLLCMQKHAIERKEVLQNFLEEIDILKERNMNNPLIGHLKVHFWVESHLRNISFSVLIELQE